MSQRKLHPKRFREIQNYAVSQMAPLSFSFNYSIDQNNPYLDHALRFVLASLDDDRSNNKDRECSEKILVLVVTDIVEKWSNGKRDLARLKTMGVKTLFVVVGKAAAS